VKKEELARLVDEYGDAVITYRSENSNKLKYNVCTLDFSTPYIQQKKNRAKESNSTLLLFLLGHRLLSSTQASERNECSTSCLCSQERRLVWNYTKRLKYMRRLFITMK